MSERYIVVEVVLGELEIVGDDQWPMTIWIVVDCFASPAKQVSRGYATSDRAKAAAKKLNDEHEQRLEEERKSEQEAEPEEKMNSGSQMTMA